MVSSLPADGTQRERRSASRRSGALKRTWVSGLVAVVIGIVGWTWLEIVGAPRPDAPRSLAATAAQPRSPRTDSPVPGATASASPALEIETPAKSSSAPERKPWETPDREVVTSQLQGYFGSPGEAKADQS